MRTTILLVMLLLAAFAASGAQGATVRSTLVFGEPQVAFAVPGLPVEPSLKGPVLAFETTQWATAGAPLEPSAKGPVAHLELVAN